MPKLQEQLEKNLIEKEYPENSSRSNCSRSRDLRRNISEPQGATQAQESTNTERKANPTPKNSNKNGADAIILNRKRVAIRSANRDTEAEKAEVGSIKLEDH